MAKQRPSPQQWPHRALRRVAAGRYAAGRPGQPWSSTACARTARPPSAWSPTWSRRIQRARHSRLHFLRLRAHAAAARSRRRVPSLPLLAPLSRSYSRQLDGRRSSGINGGTAMFCIPAQQNDSAAGPLDAGARRFRRRPAVSRPGPAAGLGGIRHGDPHRSSADAVGASTSGSSGRPSRGRDGTSGTRRRAARAAGKASACRLR